MSVELISILGLAAIFLIATALPVHRGALAFAAAFARNLRLPVAGESPDDIVDASPFSTSGALAVANVPPEESERVFRQLMVWGFSMVAIGPWVAGLIFVVPVWGQVAGDGAANCSRASSVARRTASQRTACYRVVGETTLHAPMSATSMTR